MGLATLLAWRIKMPDLLPPPTIELDGSLDPGFENIEIGEATKPVTDPTGIPHTTVFAQQNKKIPEWFIVLKHYRSSPNCMAFLFIAWLMGIGIGLIFTFLFWHLQVSAYFFDQFISMMEFLLAWDFWQFCQFKVRKVGRILAVFYEATIFTSLLV